MIFWLLLTFINALLPALVSTGAISTSIMTTNQAGAVGYILVGIGLMALIIFRPQGIFGDKKEVMLDAR